MHVSSVSAVSWLVHATYLYMDTLPLRVFDFRIERTISLSRLAKVLKLISLCNLHSRTKELCRRLLDSRVIAKTSYCNVAATHKHTVNSFSLCFSS